MKAWLFPRKVKFQWFEKNTEKFERAFKLVQVFGIFFKKFKCGNFVVMSMSTFELSLNDHWKFEQFSVNVINSFAL